MIWILALLLMAAGVGLGLRLGAICAAFSFVGIVLATLFARLVGKMIHPLLPHLGISDPILLWAIPSVVGCLIVYFLIMAAGLEVHRRVNVYYKYKAGDLRLALWERMNLRVGGCLGVLTGAGWLVVVSFFIYNIGYYTTQVAPSEDEPKTIRLANNLSYGLQSTGLDKAARAVGSMPDWFYKTADFAGFLVQNPRLLARMGDYPAFLSLAERSDIQPLAQDSSLVQSWNTGASIDTILGDGQVQGIINNTNLVATIWSIIQTNMDDITNYLVTGKSSKFDSEKIIGRWDFDVVPALGALLESQPKIKPNDLKAIRALWNQTFDNTTFVA
ncbi:MAG TPA: CvpA family protein, partial [Candidatus Sulfotelmatobacter sp.]|nr:CvpA family protein [Candidatus Sulfotelmatobacter sp.]